VLLNLGVKPSCSGSHNSFPLIAQVNDYQRLHSACLHGVVHTLLAYVKTANLTSLEECCLMRFDAVWLLLRTHASKEISPPSSGSQDSAN
jgi:ABC-type uncharacterized transport system YnjBCD permease subunit